MRRVVIGVASAAMAGAAFLGAGPARAEPRVIEVPILPEVPLEVRGRPVQVNVNLANELIVRISVGHAG